MTIVAWDGETLAADKQATICGHGTTVTKIFRAGDGLVGFAGRASQAMEMLAWLAAGAEADDFPESQRDEDNAAAMLVITGESKILLYEFGPHPVLFEQKTFAIGSGRDYAIAAMYLGKTALEAVEVACILDTDCGCGIDTLTLRSASDASNTNSHGGGV